jgi:D-alanyl-D-alanine dipeptidase
MATEQVLKRTLEYLENHSDFVNLKTIPRVQILLKYASADNFMGKNVYGVFNEAFLHRLAAEKFARASDLLASARPGWSFLVFDALRPRSVQRLLWNHVQGTSEEGYVANPDRGSMHNFGCAIDLTLLDERGAEVDMGTAFDSFVPLSQPKLEEDFLREGALTKVQHSNRLVLRSAMTGAGFIQLSHEWWHYDAFPGPEVRTHFQIIE